MTLLQDIDAALAEAVTAEELSLQVRVHRIDGTGLHPIPDGRPARPGRHAQPWTLGRVYADANDGLACYQSTGRRVDRSYLGGAMALLSHEVDQAAKVIIEVEALDLVSREDAEALLQLVSRPL